MDPFQEQKLRDEVIYLHSLWHQGPPTPNPNPYYPRNTIPNFNPNPYYFNPNPNNFNPNPNSFNPNPHYFNPNPNNFNPNPYYFNPHPNNFNPHPYISAQLQSSNANQVKKENHLKLSNSTQFKKENRRGRGRRVDINKGNNGVTRQEPPPVSELVWPCNPDAPETIGWPVLNLKPAQTTREPTEEEKVRIFATQVQQKALKAAQEFFANNVDSDGDDNIESEDDDDDMTDDDDDGRENYKFFMKVVMDDSELRGYYEKNWESGEFSCLVCGGIGEKVGKRFKNLVALIQHSITIARTKKRQAHRAFGQAICKVLGWDINRLPVGVSAKTGDSQGNAIDDCSKVDQNAGNSVNIDHREIVLNKNDNASDMLPNKEADLSNVVGSELMVCEHSLMTADCNKGVVDLENGIASIMEGKEEVVVTGLEPRKEDGAAGIDGNEVKDNNNDNGAMDRLKENVENLVIS